MKKLTLPFRVKRPILACGADLKGAFALAKGNIAWLFDGFGDLADLDNLTRYERAVKSAIKKLKIDPKIVVCDLHPGYFSGQFAQKYTQYAQRSTLYETQHHEAHIVSAMVDNNIKGKVLGVAFDGTGYGWDGNIWGGEFFIGGVKNLKRVGHLDYVPMPGGDKVITEPWRMAASYLYSACGNIKNSMNKKNWPVLKDMIDKKINSPMTSSMGRLFDAVGSLVLNKSNARFEAELPIELEKIASRNITGHYNFGSSTEVIKDIVKDIEKRMAPSAISAKFHNSIVLMVLKVAKRFKIKKIILSGGVFQNKFLTDRILKKLSENGFKVYMHSRIQTNDSGIPMGQIAIVNARVSCA